MMTNAKPLLVVGAPRSGTKSFAEMFGIAHEVQFTPTTTELPATLQSESSWMIVPFIQQILDRGDDVRFVHAIRHPLRVAASLSLYGVWSDKKPHQWIERWIGPYDRTEEEMILGVWLWCRWVEMIPTCPTLCIEDIHMAPWLNQSVPEPTSRKDALRDTMPEPTWEDVHDTALMREANFLWATRSGRVWDVPPSAFTRLPTPKPDIIPEGQHK